ncbi:MAG: head-tail adaptor protein [Ktedonobacteraceae bacterium]
MAGTKDQIDSSDLDRRIQIQSISGKTPDGFVDVWSTIYTCWANIQNFPHGRGLFRRFLYSQLYPQMNTTIQIRYQQSVRIDATMRVLYPAHGVNHIYQILGVENPLEANVSLWLLCQENQAQAAN